MLAWAAMLRAGLGRLKLKPAEFWALTPYELLVMLGIDGAGGSMTRDKLAALMAAFPDTEKDRFDG